ncbi:MAG: ATP-binding protein [Hyphomicrobiaceae bacterium]|nr:ATP-binding protein [Hyphomicrobiaceae bacterium]
MVDLSSHAYRLTARLHPRRLLVGVLAVARDLQALGLRWLADLLPKGLYARALIIIIAPIVVLEGVVAFVFMERHWQAVTRRLSEATARDIAALIEVYDVSRTKSEQDRLIEMARDKLALSMQILPPGDLPPARPKPFFDLLDRALSREISRFVDRPYWIDTVGQSRLVEIRVRVENAVLRFVATRRQTYASNSEIFLMWMVGSSVILLTFAIMFLRNQIKPILRLAEAADAFGKGRPEPPDFRPRGAREVRQAAQAFMEMKERITTHVEQRTTMLAGVSHDLRTILTRFKLQLAFLGDTPEANSLKADVNEMQHMLEDYLAFAKGDGGEAAKPASLKELLADICDEAQIMGIDIEFKMRKRRKDIVLPLKRNALKRAITNLVSNAARFGERVIIRAATERHWVRIEVDDDGPGIPEAERENVFRPFYRLDVARNQDTGNTGLGLAIARDIARSHGGDITLGESSMGGLRAIISLPL